MDFPTYELQEVPVTDVMEKAFGVRPVKAILGLDLVCVFESEEIVRNMNPDQELLKKSREESRTPPPEVKKPTAFPAASARN